MDASDQREYVLYLRKSRGRAGISRQRTITTAHVERLGGKIAREFADTDRTAFQRVGGARPERAGFDEMVAFARASPGLGIAAWHADRLIRNSGDTEILIEMCAAGRHIVETPSGGSYDLGTASGRKRLRSDSIDAAYEVDHAIERITAQKLEAAAEGQWLGGPVPFGWQKGPDGDLVLCLAEAEGIAGATAGVLRGMSVHGIARRWNADGLRTRRGRNVWTAVEVRAVLLRARNAGLHVHQGEVTGVKGKWPAIVTEDQWRACRAVLTDSSRRTSPGPERRWLLSGIVTCGACDAKLIASTTGSSRGSRPVYRCRRGGGIVHVARDCNSLDEFVTGYVLKIIADRDDAGELLVAPPDVTLLDTEIASVKAQLKELTGQAKARVVSAGWAAGVAGKFEADIDRLRERRAALTRPMALSPFAGKDPLAVWKGMDLDERRAVVAFLVAVKVSRSPKGRPPGWSPGRPYFDARSVKVTLL